MTNQQFESLVHLIETIGQYDIMIAEHRNDRDFVRARLREKASALEEYRSQLVTIPDVPDDEDHTI